MSDSSFNNTTLGGFNQSMAAVWQAQRMKSAEWIFAEVVSIIVTLFALYLVSALTCYELKKRGYTFSQTDSSDYSTVNQASERQSPTRSLDGSPRKFSKQIFKVRRAKKTNHEERYESWLRGLNILAAAYALLKCLSIQLDLYLGTTTASLCTGFAFTSVICNGGSFISVYLLLWLRQWAVHSHPALQHLPVKMLRRLSWILLSAIILTFISLCVLFFITIKVTQGPRGCLFADEGSISQGARSGAGIVFTVVFQPALLALLLYPLLRHTINRRKAFGMADKNLKSPQDESESKIYAIIRRLLVSLILCSISDIGGVVAAFLLEKFPIFYISLVYDVNITFGAYVITCSFVDWRYRIFPFCKFARSKKDVDNNEQVEKPRSNSVLV